MPLTISLRPNPTPTDGKKSLNAFPYSSAPSWRNLTSNVTISYSTIQGQFNFGVFSFSAFSNWFAGSASNIFSTTVRSSYAYTFDGGLNNISDGGFDMWDTGNFISLTFSTTIRRGVSTINYGTVSTFTNEGGFYITPSNQWPQTALAYIKNGTIGWTNSGDVGTDGLVGSSNSNISGSYTCPGGRFGNWWANQNYGTADPTICYTWYTIQEPRYQTNITSSNDNRKTAQPPANAYVQHYNLTGCNIIFAQTLLSVRRTLPTGLGYFIPSTTIEGFLSTFVESAVLNFS